MSQIELNYQVLPLQDRVDLGVMVIKTNKIVLVINMSNGVNSIISFFIFFYPFYHHVSLSFFLFSLRIQKIINNVILK